jgi:hypothetical protein
MSNIIKNKNMKGTVMRKTAARYFDMGQENMTCTIFND